MVDYIKQIAEAIIADPPQGNARVIFESLSEELNRLDPRDFLPVGQANFVRIKAAIKNCLLIYPVHQGIGSDFVVRARELAKSAREILDLYGGENSRTVVRSFDFIQNPDLKIIVERDYRELSLILFPSGAWKSTVVMAGSILEAILHDRLTAGTATLNQALAATHAPKKKDLTKGEWKLHDLIEVAVELNLLPTDRASAIDIILRDYRNFVHPMKEVRGVHPCTEAEALMAKGALDSVCNHLTDSAARPRGSTVGR
jgi:hypothetical protein